MSLVPSSLCSSSPTLLSIPPEILLQILSHLPSSSCLHSLSITSRTLNTFIHTHAATITNSLITSNHSKSSQILNVHHTENSGGFIVPTHPLILTEERRIQRDKIIASGCHCSPCQLMLHAGTSSSSDLSLYSSSSENEGLITSCMPTLSMTATRVNECKARQLYKTVKLTEPGPQLLVFLERYGWEVEARWDIFNKHQHQITKEDDDVVDEEAHQETNKEEEKRRTFEFMVGNYCVRRFLEDSEKELANFASSTQKIHPTPKPTIRNRFKSRMDRHRQEKKQQKKAAEAVSRPPAARMFGEIEKASTTVVVEKDGWIKGLIWYHGSKYSLDESPAAQDPVIGSEKAVTIKTNKRARDCMSGVKVGLRKAKSSIGSMLRHLRCVGGFQSLDD